MPKVGKVISIEGKFARVRVSRPECCCEEEDCTKTENPIIIKMHNPVGAQEGQLVEYRIQEQQMIGVAFTVFLLPLLAAGLGFAAGYYLLPGMKDTFGYLGAALFFFLSLLYIRYKNRRASEDEALLPVIEKII